MNIFHFSGGKTSAYMTIKYYRPGDIVIFCDTGREDEGTIKFIDDVSRFENIPIIKASYPGGFQAMIKKRGTIPNQFKRKCTEELKIKTARRYLRSSGLFSYTQNIGFRADEPARVLNYKHNWKSVMTKFPLFEDGIRKEEIELYWKNKPYNLQIDPLLNNCDLCFLKGLKWIIAILQKYPDKAQKWIDDEKLSKNGYTYHKGISMQQIADFAKTTTEVFSLTDIDKYQCVCSV